MLMRLAVARTALPPNPFAKLRVQRREKSGRVSDRDSPGLSFPQARMFGLFISGAVLPLFPSLDFGPWPLSACPPVWPCCLSVFGICLFLGGRAPAVQVLVAAQRWDVGPTAVPAALPAAPRTHGQGCVRPGSPRCRGFALAGAAQERPGTTLHKSSTNFVSP